MQSKCSLTGEQIVVARMHHPQGIQEQVSNLSKIFAICFISTSAGKEMPGRGGMFFYHNILLFVLDNMGQR